MTLKLILVSGLYPQVAVSDEFNHLKVFFLIFFCYFIELLKLNDGFFIKIVGWSAILSHRIETIHVTASNGVFR